MKIKLFSLEIVIAGSLLMTSIPSQGVGPIADPIPEPVAFGDLSAKLVEFVQIPASAGSPPLARISMLYHSRDSTGRLFINDLRGKLYLIDGETVSVYLDLESQMPNFIESPGLGTGFQSFAFHPDFATNGKFYTDHAESPETAILWKCQMGWMYHGGFTGWDFSNRRNAG